MGIKELTRLEQIIQVEEEFREILNQHTLLRARVLKGEVRDQYVARLDRGGMVLIIAADNRIRLGSVLFPGKFADLRTSVVASWNRHAPDLRVSKMLLSTVLDLEIIEIEKSMALIADAKNKSEAES
jgi:hypothetical protein